MNKFILILVIAITLSGCATTRWEHPTKKHTNSYLDLLHCKQDAKTMVLYQSFLNGYLRKANNEF